MPSKEQPPRNEKTSSKQRPPKPVTKPSNVVAPPQAHPEAIIQQAGLDPGRLTPRHVLQLQQAVGNRAVNQLLARDGAQSVMAQHPGIDSAGVKHVIQRTLYDNVKQKADTHQALTKLEIEAATTEFIVELVRNQGYQDADGNPVGPTEMQNMNFMWDFDYGAVPGMVTLPTLVSVIQDIKNGVFKMALRHELGHYIRSIANQPTAFQDAERVINGINWNKLHQKYPQGDMNNWKEEVRADLKSIRLRYIEEHRFPTKSELKAYETALGPTVDNMHPPAAFRVQTMKKFISKIKPSRFCYLTTACVEARGLPDNCEELTLLRHFRDAYLLQKPNGEALVELYYKYSPGIVAKIDQDPQKDAVYDYIYQVLRDCVEAIKRDELEYTYLKYCEMVVKLKELFIPAEWMPDYEI